MVVLLKDAETQHLEDLWHAKLDAVRRQYISQRTPELRAEYRRLLKDFADFVVRGKRPRIY